MAKCGFCKRKIKPYFEVCFECYQKTSGLGYELPEPIVRAEFMQQMGIV